MNWYKNITPNEYLLTIKVKANAAKTRIVEIIEIPDGNTMYGTSHALVIAVHAPANDNKANQVLIKFIAKWLDISQRNIIIKSGKTSRLKVLQVSGDALIGTKLDLPVPV